MVNVDFVALPELTRDPPGKLSDTDQKDLIRQARSRGLTKYEYSDDEHRRLRNQAESDNASKKFIKEFDTTYNFIYWMTLRAKAGKINAMGGMCSDVALKNYAEYADIIEKESAKRGRR